MRQLKSPLDSTLIRECIECPDDSHEAIEIHSVGPLNELIEGMLSFSLSDPGTVERSCFLIGPEAAELGPYTYRATDPRLSFIRALGTVIQLVGLEDIQSEQIEESVKFGSNVVLGKGVRIGEGTTIGNNVVIGDFVSIGKHCDVKSGAVIGENGFGFSRDAGGIPIRFPHIASVTIGDYVEVGSFSTINRGALSETTIHNHVKMDDHVHIAHNVVVHEGTLLTAGATIGGSGVIGSECWIGLNASIFQKVQIGNKSVLGIGTNVFKDVEAESTMFGYVAKRLPKI